MSTSGGGGGLPVDPVTVATAGTVVLGTRVTGDNTDRYTLAGDGSQSWGPGNGALDATISRPTSGAMRATIDMQATGLLIAKVGGAGQAAIGAVGPASQGGLVAGSASDVNLYRSAAGAWTTDGSFTVAGNLTCANTVKGGGFDTTNTLARVREEQSGGFLQLTQASASLANPGANIAKVYLRPGSASGVKLVVRAGAAGAETTILDNIPT